MKAEEMRADYTALTDIHLEDLRADCIPLAPLAEQHRIVAEVDRRLSHLREAEAQVNANLRRAERLRQTIPPFDFAQGRL